VRELAGADTLVWFAVFGEAVVFYELLVDIEGGLTRRELKVFAHGVPAWNA
jgi:hypothetical protein